MKLFVAFKNMISQMNKPVAPSIPLIDIEAGMIIEFMDRRDGIIYRGEVEPGPIYFDEDDCPHLICKTLGDCYTSVYQNEITAILSYADVELEAA